mgnify:CR=1 FL=1
MINTYDLTIINYGYTKEYRNISRVAVKSFLDWHRASIGFVNHIITVNHAKNK